MEVVGPFVSSFVLVGKIIMEVWFVFGVLGVLLWEVFFSNVFFAF